jgi:hypothetical protein
VFPCPSPYCCLSSSFSLFSFLLSFLLSISFDLFFSYSFRFSSSFSFPSFFSCDSFFLSSLFFLSFWFLFFSQEEMKVRQAHRLPLWTQYWWNHIIFQLQPEGECKALLSLVDGMNWLIILPHVSLMGQDWRLVDQVRQHMLLTTPKTRYTDSFVRIRE